MSKPVTIIGFMGSGKSTIGRMLASEWGYGFIDLDRFIEEKYKLSIPDIFDKYLEEGFRKIESEALKEVLVADSQKVISLGGGTPCFNNNMEMILQKSCSIYLKLSEEEIYRRLSKSANPRPLVRDKTPEQLKVYIKTELEKREKYYEQAGQTIESDCIIIKDLLTFIPRPR